MDFLNHAFFSHSLTVGGQFISNINTPVIQPLVIASTTRVVNLNADMVDGLHGADLVPITRSVLPGTGLTGGGPLNSDVTLSVNFGTTVGTVAQGNDSRIVNGQTAYSWGNRWVSGLDSPPSKNLNTTDQSGVFTFGTDVTNGPVAYGTLINFVGATSDGNAQSSSTSWTNQIAWSTGNQLFFRQRIYTYNPWSSWERIWTSLDLTNGRINSWDLAYSWGNHALAGYATNSALTSGLAGKENSFSKGNIVQGANVTLSGTLTGRLVGAGDITISAAATPITYGTTAGTAAEGNDSRIINGQTAFGWGNHASAGYVPGARTLTINGVAQTLAADRSWTVPIIVTNITDGNEPQATGFYVNQGAGTTNMPVGYGAIFQINRINGTGMTSRFSQLLLDTYSTNPSLYLRNQGVGGAYSAWFKMASESFVTTTLASYVTTSTYTSGLAGKENTFSKGNIVAGTNVTISGTLTGRLVGSGDITINATGGGAVGPGTVNYIPLYTSSTAIGDSSIQEGSVYITSKKWLIVTNNDAGAWNVFISANNGSASTIYMNNTATEGWQTGYANDGSYTLAKFAGVGGGTVKYIFGNNGQLNIQGTGAISPLTVTSSVVVTNFNADMVDGLHASSFVQTSRTISINGTSYDLSANRSWTGIGEARWTAGLGAVSGSANSFEAGGLRTWGTENANTPAAYGTMITFVGASSTADTGSNVGSFNNQLAWSTGDQLFFRQRIYTYGTWNDWKRIWSTADFTSGNVSNWNTAYGWGNHASAGYATTAAVAGKENAFSKGNIVAGTGVTISGTLTGRLVGAGDITINSTGGGDARWTSGTTGIGNANNVDQGGLFTWGDTSTNVPAGYGTIVNFVGASPTPDAQSNAGSWTNQLGFTTGNQIYYRQRIFTYNSWGSWIRLWTTADFTATNVSNWNTAYGWGNHASAGYATTAALAGKENSFSKGNIVAGSNVTISGTLTGRLVGAGDITINASGGSGGITYTAGLGIGLSGTEFFVGAGQGLIQDWDGLYVNFGTANDQVARGDHGHTGSNVNSWLGYVPMNSNRYIIINGITGYVNDNPNFGTIGGGGGVGGSGSTNRLSVWTSGSNLGNSRIEDNGSGRVQILDTGSGGGLRVFGDGLFSGNVDVGAASFYGYQFAGNYVNMSNYIYVGSSHSGSDAYNGKAILQLDSSSKGVLIPRMSRSSRLAISSPPQGLLVFQTDVVGSSARGFKYYDGSTWLHLDYSSTAA